MFGPVLVDVLTHSNFSLQAQRKKRIYTKLCHQEIWEKGDLCARTRRTEGLLFSRSWKLYMTCCTFEKKKTMLCMVHSLYQQVFVLEFFAEFVERCVSGARLSTAIRRSPERSWFVGLILWTETLETLGHCWEKVFKISLMLCFIFHSNPLKMVECGQNGTSPHL